MTAVRPYRPADQPGILALLDDRAPPIYRWKLNAMHGRGRDEPSRWRTKVAAGPDGEVRGAPDLPSDPLHFARVD